MLLLIVGMQEVFVNALLEERGEKNGQIAHRIYELKYVLSEISICIACNPLSKNGHRNTVETIFANEQITSEQLLQGAL